MKRRINFPTEIPRWAILSAVILWTLLSIASLLWNWRQVERSTIALAEEEALSNFNKDLIYRAWNSEHGGVYVPATEETPPNPYLSHLPERDITTTSGTKLTLINPAYMTRQVHEIGKERYGTLGHITSLNPIRPENAADEWETKALLSFEDGIEMVVAVETLNGQPHIRLIRPLLVERACLSCHAAQGYQEGDIRGGISVSVPMAPYQAAAAAGQYPLLIGHLLIWLLVLAGLTSSNTLLHRVALARRAEFEHMVGQISSNFVKLAPGKADEGITRALAAIGEFAGVDRTYIFQFFDNHGRMKSTHEWRSDDIVNQEGPLRGVAPEDVPWLMAKLNGFETVHISNVMDLPPEAQAEKKRFNLKGVQSFAAAPLTLGNRLTGFLGVDAVREECIWTDQDLILLQLVGETIVHALDRDRAERQLSDQTERLNRIIHGTNVGTWEWNVRTGEAIFNERWAEMIGYTLEEIAPWSINTWTRLCHPEDWKTSNTLLHECFNRKREYYNCQVRMRHKNGQWVWVQDRGKVTTWTESGRPEWMYGTRADISQQKRQERERRKMYEHLQYTQRLESLGVLAGSIAHDFNNILAIIRGNAELVLARISPPSLLEDLLSEIISASERAADLCSQMLFYSGKGILEKQHISVGDLVEGTLGMLKASISKKCIIKLNLEKGLPHVHADPTQLRQILMNLVTNASEAIQDSNGVITIATGSEDFSKDSPSEYYIVEPAIRGRHVYFTVTDTGHGMDREHIQRIFEPFFTTKFIGRGLGLSAVVGIVRRHEGALLVQSEPDKGAMFKVLFPALTGSSKEETSASGTIG